MGSAESFWESLFITKKNTNFFPWHLGTRWGAGAALGPAGGGQERAGALWQKEQGEPQGLVHPLAGTSFGCGILQPGAETEQGVTSVGSRWHPGTHSARPQLRAGAVGPAPATVPCVCGSGAVTVPCFCRSGASVSAQECGPVWLDTGQADGKLCLRAHSQEYCKK